MDFNSLINIVSQIGFPIVVCLIAFNYIDKIQTQHKEETDKMAQAIANNTLVIQKLCDKLGGN